MKSFQEHAKIIYLVFLDSPYANEFGGSWSGLARMLEVSVGKVQTWRESGTWPGARELYILHEKLKFSYTWLLVGEGEPFAEPGPPPEERSRLAELEVVCLEREGEIKALKEQVDALRGELLEAQRELIAAQKELIVQQRNLEARDLDARSAVPGTEAASTGTVNHASGAPSIGRTD